jgi:DNA topoisomerase IB
LRRAPDGKDAPVPRLRTADCSGPGITRRRRGRGFEFLDDEGRRVEEPEVLGRERILACAVRLLDRGFFRIGSEDYAERNESYWPP